MATNDDRFKQQLAPALELWVSEDLVSADQARRLRAYYQLDELAHLAPGRFGSVLLAFGGILVGLGLITFVAANWAAISPGTRAIAGLIVMVALNVAGFKLWQRPTSHRLGSAFLLLGAMALGGNIALMAQWFQIGGSGWGLFVAWGLGALAMAVGLRHGLIGALSAVVMMFAAAGVPEASHWIFLWVFALVYVPLASWCDSRITLWAGFAGIFGLVLRLAGPMGVVAATASLGIFAAGLWAWAAWQDGRLPALSIPGARAPWPMRPDQDALVQAQLPRFMGALLVVSGLHLWSFRDVWKEAFDHVRTVPTSDIVSLGAFLALAGVAWALLTPKGGDRWPHLGLGLVVALGSALVAFQPWGAVAPMNLLLLGTTLALAWHGLHRAERSWFWLGILGLTFQVFARFLEYETDLMAKSAVFTIWGVLLLIVGWRFERRLALRAQEVAHA
ncbi:MAG: putative rane protein [Cyanobacteria bacterium RYN_339]|nr:putative rane protein [Cyanobacteria bacterium RYN_339]